MDGYDSRSDIDVTRGRYLTRRLPWEWPRRCDGRAWSWHSVVPLFAAKALLGWKASADR